MNATWSIPSGYPIAYRDAGKGVPLVLVHGSLTDYRVWQSNIDVFSAKHRVIAASATTIRSVGTARAEVSQYSSMQRISQSSQKLLILEKYTFSAGHEVVQSSLRSRNTTPKSCER